MIAVNLDSSHSIFYIHRLSYWNYICEVQRRRRLASGVSDNGRFM